METKLYPKKLLQSILIFVLFLVCFAGYSQNAPDTIYRPQINQDSVIARLKFIRDSIEIREKFVRDSIEAREKFVRDSIARRKQILDSVTLLRNELQTVLQAVYQTTQEDIISYADQIPIIGDSTLGDYVYHKLPLTLGGAYTPWLGKLSIAKSVRFTVDNNSKKIIALQAPLIRTSLSYLNQGMLLIMQEAGGILSSSFGKFYKIPVDTVFYDRYKKIVKISKYLQIYMLVNNNQKGNFMFATPVQIRQYQYDTNNQLTKYDVVKYCDRFSVYEPVKVCGGINYSVSKQGTNYLVTRRNNPANAYSDGTFKVEFDAKGNIKCISFSDLSNKPVWQRFIDLNQEGNVSCYTDRKDGYKVSTLCMTYHNEPNAKYPVESIATTFEKDGVDYWQKNITTEKARTRDRMTMEWGPWKDE
jgi:hypothetical protein